MENTNVFASSPATSSAIEMSSPTPSSTTATKVPRMLSITALGKRPATTMSTNAFNKLKQKKSPVWNFFKELPDGTIACLVKDCKQIYKRMQDTGTSNMRKHLRLLIFCTS